METDGVFFVPLTDRWDRSLCGCGCVCVCVCVFSSADNKDKDVILEKKKKERCWPSSSPSADMVLAAAALCRAAHCGS